MNKTKLYTLGPIIASGAVGLVAIVLTIGVGANGAANSSSAGWFGTYSGSSPFNRNYFTRQSYTTPTSIECDVYPRGSGDGRVTQEDYDLIGRFSVGTEKAMNGVEFQKADCAPKGSLGDGKIDVADWVQAGRYWEGLDPLQTAGGPTEPISVVYEGDVWPRPNGDGRITQEDYDQVGRFSVGLDVPQKESEFQRADVAPKDSKGDGQIVVSDWVQTGRYWQNLDSLQTVGGPTGPGQ